MTIEEAIKRCENIRDGAFAVLDSGFGTNDNENPLVYKKRVEFANICIAALRAQQERENPQPLTLEELLRMDGQPVDVYKRQAPLCLYYIIRSAFLQLKFEIC